MFAATGYDVWIALAPAISIVLVAIAGWITYQTKQDVAVVKIDVSKHGEDMKVITTELKEVKIHTNKMATDMAAKSQEAGIAQGQIEERARADNAIEAGIQLKKIDSKIEKVGNGIKEHVEEVRDDVKVIKKDTGEIHTRVVEEVKSGVVEAVDIIKKNL